jgi:hypothetical protein
MYHQSRIAAKNFTVAYRARFEPEVHFRTYFTRCAPAPFWERVEQAYDKLVTHGDWYEPEFEWVLSQLLRRCVPVTGRNLQQLRAVYLQQVAPVRSIAALVDVRSMSTVRSLVKDFNNLGQREEREARLARQ